MIKKNMLKKLLASTLLATFLLTAVFVPIAHAYDSWYNQSFQNWYQKVYDSDNPQEIFGERYTAGQVQWILYSLTALFINRFVNPEIVICLRGGDLGKCAEAFTGLITLSKNNASLAQLKEGEQDYEDESFLASYFKTNRLSGVGYLVARVQRFNLIPEARAQGFGFGVFENHPVLTLWKASRNISYAFFILAIIIIAFMIMFRVKISPQTVMTVQSALPKIVIALILITFSYAIAGLLIDLTYVVIGLITTIFANAPNLFEETSWRDLFDYLINGPLNTGILGIMAQYSGVAMTSYLWVAWRVLISKSFIAGILSFILYVIMPIIIAVVMLILIIRVFWFLLKTYLNIILGIIFAPIQIAVGVVFPGGGFGPWLRSMVANLAVYPIVAVLIILAFIFLAGAAGPYISEWLNVTGIAREVVFGRDSYFPFRFNPVLLSGQAWDPPLTVGTGSLQPLLFLGISFVLMTLIPKIGEMIKSLIEGKPFAYGTAIGETFKAPLALGRMGLGAYSARVEEHGRRIAKEKYVDPMWMRALKSVGVIRT